ncbi:hypothetical protein ACFL27_03080 [candidate division CSSED10-310 bacterium]|uniref:DUF3096 domain-containing protein n=1 Tax=candidate division CSSED10-310 bacterium TaxID=2855610 RepID=A0ABV6YSN9_UNCC1
MKILRIIIFVILFLIALKLIFIVGWLLKVGILIILIGVVIWLVKSLFGNDETPDS